MQQFINGAVWQHDPNALDAVAAGQAGQVTTAGTTGQTVPGTATINGHLGAALTIGTVGTTTAKVVTIQGQDPAVIETVVVEGKAVAHIGQSNMETADLLP